MKSKDKEQSVYEKIKEALGVVSQFIVTAPVKLPPKVVAVARYVALALGLLEAVENGMGKQEDEGNENE
ncbi:hypothetical protein [Parapedobacter sp. 10938]|uniref:hypothetical protein n=1 Tax=Parapedobacter flavus TaxID=3110225 RepID=UPI002DBB05B2|nr:hypothetical protein [Parapedobacter sp. 10938]MEC3881781.1 hypothetical protein [Parapedobacter sp. 10938]